MRDGTGRCEQHRRQARRESDQQRGSAHERGYSAAWRRAREGFLRKHPLCVMCQARGDLVPATIVDHKVPHKGDKALFWDRSNWQGLCKPDHDRKTATEDGGWGREGRGAVKSLGPPD